jgi:hypothetical protein
MVCYQKLISNQINFKNINENLYGFIGISITKTMLKILIIEIIYIGAAVDN